MTRAATRWIRAIAVSTICANVVMLYGAPTARAAATCPSVVTHCSSNGLCAGNNKQVWFNMCNEFCEQAGGPTCQEFPLQLLPPGCVTQGCSQTSDELVCNCHTV
jgi:hypothetical protein